MAVKRATNRPSIGQTRVESEERPKRIPVSGQRNILNVRGIDTDQFVCRWVNDVDDRIRVFERGGWEKVTDDVDVGDRTVDSSDSKQSFVTKYVGANVTAYLMKIRRDWYEEDQEAKAKAIKESESALKGAKVKRGDTPQYL